MPYRAVFHLRDLEGFTDYETAKALSLSVSAVKSRIHRARLVLRDKLSDYFYEQTKQLASYLLGKRFMRK
jgi:RNA polymerase sigma-70 factor, ECF subfamily